MDPCAQIRKLLLSFVLLLVYRICGIQRVHKNRYEASGIDTSSNSGARGWTSFKRNILYAIRSLKKNGAEINRSVCIHAQTAHRCRTRRVHSSIHTATPTRRVPFASTENTSRCGLSVPDEPDAVDAVCTRATRRVPFANGTRVGSKYKCEHGHCFTHFLQIVACMKYVSIISTKIFDSAASHYYNQTFH